MLNANLHQALGKSVIQIGWIGGAPVGQDGTGGAPEDHGLRAPFAKGISNAVQSRKGHDMVVTPGFGKGIDEQGGKQEGEAC